MATPKKHPDLSPATKAMITQVLDIMKSQDITPRGLCLDTGVDEGQFSKWTNFKGNISMDKLRVVLDYLGYELAIIPKSEMSSDN